ncbi:hypothetical protein C8J56DRAFT_1010257 [Mycena floridula]|nr:hypothetical protein C8J56DRAFT_1010257 [Mycena floridula]
MSFHQAQAEGLCLRFPENVGIHANLSFENAIAMLQRGAQVANSTPFAWAFIDKPAEGQVYMLCLPQGAPYPVDGIRWQEPETKITIPVGQRELEISEIKCGFVPGGDSSAWRVRRRFRFTKGGHELLVLVHYTRGQAVPIIPALMDRPVRQYPLRHVTEPSVFVLGDKMGQKVPPPGMNAMGMNMPMGMSQQQAMLAQQNSSMEALERRKRESARAARAGPPRPPHRVEDDDSADEADMTSTKTLAMTRYRRNHDFMNEVFRHAAYGPKSVPPAASPLSIFDKGDLDDKVAKLEAEISALRARRPKVFNSDVIVS